MSTVVSSDRRIWLPLLLSMAVIAAAMVAVLNLPTTTSGVALLSPVHPTIPQAPWRIKAHPAGSLGKIKPKHLKFLEDREPAIKSLIRDVYNAAFIDRDSLKSVLNKNFLGDAAAALLKADVGFPSGASEVRTLRREASVAIEAAHGTHAAASVHVLARGQLGDKTLRLAHRSLLWLEKSDDGWRVIGFEISQGPTR